MPYVSYYRVSDTLTKHFQCEKPKRNKVFLAVGIGTSPCVAMMIGNCVRGQPKRKQGPTQARFTNLKFGMDVFLVRTYFILYANVSVFIKRIGLSKCQRRKTSGVRMHLAKIVRSIPRKKYVKKECNIFSNQTCKFKRS